MELVPEEKLAATKTENQYYLQAMKTWKKLCSL